jgi:hypothetical protein
MASQNVKKTLMEQSYEIVNDQIQVVFMGVADVMLG